jgi:hypothetical protein
MSRLRPLAVASAAVASLLSSPPAPAGPVPDGAEFRLNQVTAGDQRQPAVALDIDGGIVAVWASTNQESQTSSDGVFGRRYAADGSPAGGEFQVNAHTPLQQFQPAVATDPEGNFVVAWTSDQQDGSGYGIFARRMSRTGASVGGEIQVNTYTLGRQQFPAVASDVEGNFVVVWESLGQDGSVEGVYRRQFSAGGVPLSGEMQVNSYTILGQGHPAVAMAPDGRSVVVWDSSGQIGASHEVYAQRYDENGSPAGFEFRVNSYTQNSQYRAAVAMDAGGGFVVAWESVAQDGDGLGVFARRFDAAGVPVDPADLAVNLATAGTQRDPTVAIDPSGNFAVGWTGAGLDGSGDGVFLRRFARDGTPSDAVEVFVNSHTTANQSALALAAEVDGDVVALWQSFGQDGTQHGVYGQRYTRPTITVTDFTGGTGGPGCKLRDAIAAANSGGPAGGCAVGGDGGAIIELAPQNYIQLTEIDAQSAAAGLPAVTVPITIRGHGAAVLRAAVATCPAVNAEPEFRIFEVDEGGVLTLDQLVVAYGCLPGDGGGGVDSIATLVLRNGAGIFANRAMVGAGVRNSGALYAADSILESNGTFPATSGSGGGLYVNGGAFTLLRRSHIKGNTAAGGGGGAFLNGRAHLSHVTMFQNTASTGQGSALWTNWIGGVTTIDYSTIGAPTGPVGSATLYHDIGILALNGTAIEPYPGGVACISQSFMTAFGANADTDGSCATEAGGNVSTFPGGLGLLPPDYNGGLTMTRVPGPTSPLRDLAPACTTRAGAPVDRDQRRYPRPTDDDGVAGAGCEVGAVERGPILLDGFESGNFMFWSNWSP